jgi:negative regulator of sigma E activity
MDERLRESISALMDDESNELELQRIMSHDDNDEVQAVWARYHEVRNVIKQDKENHFEIDICASVSAVIREEPLALREEPLAVDDKPLAVDDKPLAFDEKPLALDKEPLAQDNEVLAQDAAQHVSSSVESISVIGSKKAGKESKLGGRTWLALAASVVFAVAFTFQGAKQQSGDVITTVASNGLSDSSLVKVSAHEEPIVVQLNEEQAGHFGKYLLRHAEHSVRGTQSGFMPLARVASVNSVGI